MNTEIRYMYELFLFDYTYYSNKNLVKVNMFFWLKMNMANNKFAVIIKNGNSILYESIQNAINIYIQSEYDDIFVKANRFADGFRLKLDDIFLGIKNGEFKMKVCN